MLSSLFTTFIYQPFFNLLVGIYWLINQIPSIPHKDMGVAVIVFTIALRIILLPTTIASTKSEKERRDTERRYKEIEHEFSNDPVQKRLAIKNLFKTNPRMLFAEGFNLIIQIIIAFMLWRIFAKGLGGEDIHLLYSFMPNIPQPFNLKFLGVYDLTHPHTILNLIQSLVIFAVETLAIMTSPFPMTRKEAWRLQLSLPIFSYIIFSFLPAGKKLFMITTLAFSICYTLFRYLYHLYYNIMHPPEETDQSPDQADHQVTDPPATSSLQAESK